MKYALASALLFNAGWWLTLIEPLGRSAVITSVIVCVHFISIYRVEAHIGLRRNTEADTLSLGLFLKELTWLLLVALLGWIFESFLFFAQVLVVVESDVASIGLVPVWLILIWLLFATLFRFSFLAIPPKFWLQALLGMSAVISYFFGAELNSSVSIGRPAMTSLLVISILWGCMFPVLLGVYSRWFR